jgi:YVTN family beta-propeller protein
MCVTTGMKKLIILLLVFLAACSANEKVYVANEGSGTISVIDPASLKEAKQISLSVDEMKFSPHNVQVGNIELFGDVILVTAVSKGNGGEHGGGSDQLIVIGRRFDNILKRINLEDGAHVAHVVSDGDLAYVTGTEKDALYVVNPVLEQFEIIRLPNGSMPHGLRLSDDKKTAIIAGLGNQLILVNLASKEVKSIKLPGKGVQTAVYDGKYFISIYDTKQVAVFENDELSFIDLGVEAKGPIQIYPSNDGFLYVADQGVLFDQPEGTKVYKIDIELKKVVKVIEVGRAPHGVAVGLDGRVWVTNLKGSSLSVIENDVRIAEIPVGDAPNGVSLG